MTKVFYYSFRTNKFVSEIEKVTGQGVYIIDKPAQDFEQLVQAINSSVPDVIFGIGMNKRMSRFESEAFNKSGIGKVDKASYLISIGLDTPNRKDRAGFKVMSRMTAGPCNYIAFKLADRFPDKRSYFLHLKSDDIYKLQALAV